MTNDYSLPLKEIYMKNPLNQLRDDFLADLSLYLNQKPKMSIADLIKSIIERFFKLTLHYDSRQNSIYINAIAKLFLKLKQIQLLNILIAYYKFIHSVHQDIVSSYSISAPIDFSIEKDCLLTPLLYYDSDRNISHFSLRIGSPSSEKLNHLTPFIEYYTTYYSNAFIKVHTVLGALPQGHVISISQHNRVLIKRSNSDEDVKGYVAQVMPDSIAAALVSCEKEIRLNFKHTKRHLKNFKQAFAEFEQCLLLNDQISQEIEDISPFGSVTQCTQNIFSDLEVTIITKTKNEEALIDLIYQLLANSPNYTQLFKRKTKRTVLISCHDISNEVKVELNLNNTFGLLNSSLIKAYLFSDARALIMVNTIKYWSKSRKINGNFKGHLSSYCYTLMVIYFLQRVHPPVLPIISPKSPLKSLYIRGKHFYVAKELTSASDYPFKAASSNTDPVSLLLLKFFLFYADYFNENAYCIDITSKSEVLRHNEVEYMNYFMTSQRSVYCFIDPFDYSYNPGAYFHSNSTPHLTFKKAIRQTIIDILIKQLFPQSQNI